LPFQFCTAFLCFTLCAVILRPIPVLMHCSRLVSNNKDLLIYLLNWAKERGSVPDSAHGFGGRIANLS